VCFRIRILRSNFHSGFLSVDIISSSDAFTESRRSKDPSAATSFGALLFDVARNQVVVGARDAIFRLSLKGLSLLERAAWPALPSKVSLCQMKGQSESACHNFVRVLASNGSQLLACGTSAYSPECSWRQMENIGHIVSNESGIAKCPYAPDANVTALMVNEGRLFVATHIDFSGADPAIVRTLGSAPPLRTNIHDSRWLDDPQFVGSFQTEHFVYFLFREVAVEYINCGKVIARAQCCSS